MVSNKTIFNSNLIIIAILLYIAYSVSQPKSSTVIEAVNENNALEETNSKSPIQHYDSLNANSNSFRYCSYTKLSKNFNIEIYAYQKDNEDYDFSTLTVMFVRDKHSNEILDIKAIKQDIAVFEECSYALYEKGEIDLVESPDILVADFNFDNKEDIAVATYSGGASNPYVYTFFVQAQDKSYDLDDFLTDKVSYPPRIDAENRTLYTYGHVSANEGYSYSYTLNSKGDWKESSTFVGSE